MPIFNDKHLSYRWDWAKAMYDEAQQLGIPLMAGSSVPLAERRPPIELPADAVVEEAVSIHGGGIESYDFHGLEVLQSMIEARRGGETGISRVELLDRRSLQAGAKPTAAGRRSWPRPRWPPRRKADLQAADAAAAVAADSQPQRGDHALLVTYKDGTRGTVLKVGSTATAGISPAGCAARTSRWRPRSTTAPGATATCSPPCRTPSLHFFKTGKSPYPVERTLLVSGVLDAAMHSHHAGGKPIDTPHLEFAYQPQDFRAFRETGESWRVLTAENPQPTTFEPGKG